MGNVSVDFDHVYSGRYQLKVVECKNRYSCFETIHESDLGVVETNLSNIDVTKMNIGISTIPSDIG
jgi:transcriptional regulator NrdR family protein